MLNKYDSDYFDQVKSSTCYVDFELDDIMFVIKSQKLLSSNFDITKYLPFVTQHEKRGFMWTKCTFFTLLQFSHFLCLQLL